MIQTFLILTFVGIPWRTCSLLQYKISIIVTFIQPTNQPTHPPTDQPTQPTQPNPTQPTNHRFFSEWFFRASWSRWPTIITALPSGHYLPRRRTCQRKWSAHGHAVPKPWRFARFDETERGGEADSLMEFLFLLYKWSWTKIIMGNFRFRMNFLLEVGRLVSDHQDLSCKPTFFWRIEYIGAIVRTCKKWFNNPLIWSLPNRVPACYPSSGIAGGSLAHPAPCGTTRATAAGRICGHDQSRKYQGQVRECELMEIVRPFWIFLQCQKAIMAMMRCILGRICQKRWDLLRRFFFPAICWQVMLFGRIRTRSLATKNSNAVNLPHHPVEKHD